MAVGWRRGRKEEVGALIPDLTLAISGLATNYRVNDASMDLHKIGQATRGKRRERELSSKFQHCLLFSAAVKMFKNVEDGAAGISDHKAAPNQIQIVRPPIQCALDRYRRDGCDRVGEPDDSS